MWLQFLNSRPAACVDAHALLGDLATAREVGEAEAAVAAADGHAVTEAQFQLALARIDRGEGELTSAVTRAHLALKALLDAEAVADILAALECVAACSADQGDIGDAARMCRLPRISERTLDVSVRSPNKHWSKTHWLRSTRPSIVKTLSVPSRKVER